MIERLIKILRQAGFEDVTAEEIAEMILLADFLPSPEIPTAQQASRMDEKPSNPARSTREPGSEPPAEAPDRPEPAPRRSGEGGLFDQTAREALDGEGHGIDVAPFRVPRANPLPGARKIVRALRPFRRRHPSMRRFVLDEEKTVCRIADGGSVSPVLQPAAEAWLEVALVFDESVSMRVWRQTLDQLQHLFERCGYFRDVRVWRLNTETEETKLYRATCGELRQAHQPGELLDPSRRRLIVVVSDCHAPAWHHGSAYRLVHGWAVKGPVALIQVLPPLFWAGTTMTPVDAELRAPNPATHNRGLQVTPHWYRDVVNAGGVALPVLTLDEWSLAPWAKAVAGASGISVSGLMIPPPDAMAQAIATQSEEKDGNQTSQPSAEEMIADFFNGSVSREAKQLVCYLASAPLSLPVMQLVQQAMLPGTRQSHLAEVFLSGLLYQSTTHRNPDEIIYEFHPGIREALQNRVTEAETLCVISEVSRYIESRIGETGDFEAALAVPGAGGVIKRLDPLSHRFARLSAEILRRFGRHQEFAERLERLAGPAPPPSPTVGPQSIDDFHREAESLLSLGRTEEAGIIYRRIIDLLPADRRAWHGLAETVKRGDENEESLRIMLAGIRDSLNEIIRESAAEAIGLAGLTSPEVLDALMAALRDEDSQVRAAAIASLGKTSLKRSQRTQLALIHALGDKDSRVRQQAVIGLGKIGDEHAISALHEALHDPDYRVQASAATALGRIGSERSISVLRDALRTPNSRVRQRAATALGVIGGSKAVHALSEALWDDNSYTRRPMAMALGAIGSEEAIRVLAEALRQGNRRLKLSVIAPLKNIRHEHAIAALIQVSQDEDPEVRLDVINALADVQSSQIFETLIQSARADNDERVRQAAANALKKLGAAAEQKSERAKIFISYSVEDRLQVESLYGRLRAEGFDPWMDHFDLPPDSDWKIAIGKTIRESDIFLACLSRNSVSSDLFRREIALAIGPVESCLILARLEECEIPKALQQWYTVNLHREDGWDQLLEAIGEGYLRRQESLVSQVINGRYRIEKRLADGVLFTEIYLASDLEHPGLKVVIRVPDLHSGKKPRTIRQFASEASALSLMHHPNIVRLLDRGRLPDNRPFLVMAFAAGEPLRRILRHGAALSFDSIVRIVRQVGRALDHVHLQGLIHCNLTPRVILIDRSDPGNEQMTLAGFSFATSANSVGEMQTDGGWPYLAPEQVTGKASIRSDIFAFGLIAYEMVTGRPVFESNSSLKGYQELQEKGAIIPPRTLRPELPVQAEQVLLKCLAFEPEKRYESAGLFSEALAEALLKTGETQRNEIKPSFFAFETVKLDETGQEIERHTLGAHQFIEDPGDGVRLEMVRVPGGKFMMGSPEDEAGRLDREGPRHEVEISPFYMGKFMVTKRQWRIVAGWEKAERELDPDASIFEGENDPANGIGWEDAVEFCDRLVRKTGRAYRLPTEAEWEYACRAGTDTPFSFGATITPEIVNYDGNHPYGKAQQGEYRGKSVPVGSLGIANGFGLFDMHGNIWESCHDWYSDRYYEECRRQGIVKDPEGPPSGQSHVIRGGSWVNRGLYCRSAFREFVDQSGSNHLHGFRVVVSARRIDSIVA